MPRPVVIKAKKQSPNMKNLSGQIFGRLLVVAPTKKRDSTGSVYWQCVCRCGRRKKIISRSLVPGGTESCGCLTAEVASSNSLRHGRVDSGEYKSWAAMLQRCTNPRNSAFKNYGGRGIKVCRQWLTFEGFYADMGPRPDRYTLDRIDVSKSYEPGNCRWIKRGLQARNRRDTTFIEYQGRTYSCADLYDIGKKLVSYNTFRRRLALGWDVSDALSLPRVYQ